MFFSEIVWIIKFHDLPTQLLRFVLSTDNDHYPEFVTQHETVSIPNSALVGDTVIQLQTVDADLGSTCHSDASNCDCALVTYAIESGNDDHVFQIDAFSGRVTLARPADDFNDLSFKLYVTVVNRQVADAIGGDIVGPKNYAIVMVTIGAGSKSAAAAAEGEEAVLERHRRVGAVLDQLTSQIITLII